MLIFLDNKFITYKYSDILAMNIEGYYRLAQLTENHCYFSWEVRVIQLSTISSGILYRG